MTAPATVTDDPTVLSDLRTKMDELGSHELAEYAITLGFFPPGYRTGQSESISEYWPPGADPSQPGLLVWDSTFVDVPDECEDDDGDEDDPWADASPMPAARLRPSRNEWP